MYPPIVAIRARRGKSAGVHGGAKAGRLPITAPAARMMRRRNCPWGKRERNPQLIGRDRHCIMPAQSPNRKEVVMAEYEKEPLKSEVREPVELHSAGSKGDEKAVRHAAAATGKAIVPKSSRRGLTPIRTQEPSNTIRGEEARLLPLRSSWAKSDSNAIIGRLSPPLASSKDRLGPGPCASCSLFWSSRFSPPPLGRRSRNTMSSSTAAPPPA